MKRAVQMWRTVSVERPGLIQWLPRLDPVTARERDDAKRSVRVIRNDLPTFDARSAARFGRTVGSAFVVLALVLWWRERILLAELFVGIGLALLLASIILPSSLIGIASAWMRGGALLSRVTTPVVMAVLYFLIVTPTGLVLRVVRKRHAPSPTSRWISREHNPRSNLQNQF